MRLINVGDKEAVKKNCDALIILLDKDKYKGIIQPITNIKDIFEKFDDAGRFDPQEYFGIIQSIVSNEEEFIYTIYLALGSANNIERRRKLYELKKGVITALTATKDNYSKIVKDKNVPSKYHLDKALSPYKALKALNIETYKGAIENIKRNSPKEKSYTEVVQQIVSLAEKDILALYETHVSLDQKNVVESSATIRYKMPALDSHIGSLIINQGNSQQRKQLVGATKIIYEQLRSLLNALDNRYAFLKSHSGPNADSVAVSVNINSNLAHTTAASEDPPNIMLNQPLLNRRRQQRQRSFSSSGHRTSQTNEQKQDALPEKSTWRAMNDDNDNAGCCRKTVTRIGPPLGAAVSLGAGFYYASDIGINVDPSDKLQGAMYGLIAGGGVLFVAIFLYFLLKCCFFSVKRSAAKLGIADPGYGLESTPLELSQNQHREDQQKIFNLQAEISDVEQDQADKVEENTRLRIEKDTYFALLMQRIDKFSSGMESLERQIKTAMITGSFRGGAEGIFKPQKPHPLLIPQDDSAISLASGHDEKPHSIPSFRPRSNSMHGTVTDQHLAAQGAERAVLSPKGIRKGLGVGELFDSGEDSPSSTGTGSPITTSAMLAASSPTNTTGISIASIPSGNSVNSRNDGNNNLVFGSEGNSSSSSSGSSSRIRSNSSRSNPSSSNTSSLLGAAIAKRSSGYGTYTAVGDGASNNKGSLNRNASN